MSIKPELGAGFNDYLPKDMRPRQIMFETIRLVFERFGFQPLDTPGIERKEILTGGESTVESGLNIFRLQMAREKEELALRFDLTVPLARVVAAYPQEIEKPFKRYQVGKVWRGEKPQAGRFREFVQFDADIVGAPGMMADAEIIAVIYAVMVALGFNDFLIKVNNRKILNGLAAYAGFPEDKNAKVLRSLDKLDKIGWEGVRAELVAEPEDGMEAADTPPALSADQAEAIKRFVELRSEANEETLAKVEELMANSSTTLQGIAELREVIANVRALGVPDGKWKIDLSVARGLGYYTGPVFETILTNLPSNVPSFGSVFSGGRYDDLVSRFGIATMPATGASIGVDRLFAAMERLGKVDKTGSTAKVIILNFDPACRLYYQEIASELRRAGIPTEIYLGQERALKSQLVYALKQTVPVLLIAGSRELESQTVQLRDVKKRTQQEIARPVIVEEVRKILSV